jgi:hypothetical protein
METTDITPLEFQELTANDRCDACGSQAYVQVFFKDAYLLFCAHHYNKNEKALQPTATDVYDRRDLLDSQQNRSAPEEVE